MRQLFDVLALLADDGPDGEGRDEKVHRLRLGVSLLHTNTLAAGRARAAPPNTSQKANQPASTKQAPQGNSTMKRFHR